jgi:hypothetical protein
MGFVKSVKFEGEFEGRKVTATFKPLSFADYLRCSSIEIIPASDDPKDKKKATEQEALELAIALAPILPKHMVSFEGVLDEEGQPVDFDTVCSSAYFAKLVVDMGRTLVLAANPQNPKQPLVPSGS